MELSRRGAIKGGALLGLATLVPRPLLDWARAQTTQAFLFFTEHEGAVVREATARLIPGPSDDPLETGHPGAREANVVRYIDLMLAALTVTPERVHAGGPFSGRAGGSNDMATFLPLTAVQRDAWGRRLAKLQQRYREGVVALDEAAGGDFVAAPGPARDLVLASSDVAPFRDLLFTHAIEGTYSVPEYGGNENLSGWIEIKFPGDSQPRGYTAEEVGESDGPDPYVPTGVVATVLDLIEGGGG